MGAIHIERVREASDELVQRLAELLVDAVGSGASVSFMAGLSLAVASAWWRGTLAALPSRGFVLVARSADAVVGTVQLQPAWAPNQPHRADVAKLLVHRSVRRSGVARALMAELEREARERGFTLLVLDTCKGSAAERLYTALGWTRVGEVPRYARNPDGSWCDTVFFYRAL